MVFSRRVSALQNLNGRHTSGIQKVKIDLRPREGALFGGEPEGYDKRYESSEDDRHIAHVLWRDRHGSREAVQDIEKYYPCD